MPNKNVSISNIHLWNIDLHKSEFYLLNTSETFVGLNFCLNTFQENHSTKLREV